MTIKSNIEKAEEFAKKAHAGQKYGEFPYDKHLKDVYMVLLRFGISEESMLCAAWLHDIIEDSPVTKAEIQNAFSTEVMEIVFAVTNEKAVSRKEKILKTLAKTRKNPKAIVLKLADRIANVEESIKNSKTHLDRYKNEYKSFRSSLRISQMSKELDKMWEHLDRLLCFE
jgi:(p)ppGpp synthase/HD superfamily hydrolase